MLRLPMFNHHRPASLDDAMALVTSLKKNGADYRFVAGGTDMVPNMKHGLVEPEHVISLGGLPLHGIESTKDGGLRIMAMTSLHDVATSALVREGWPALAQAASLVAGPQLRRMGTIGGNICLDTRCLYYNQTYFWRQALGFCLKKDGDTCHVVKGGKRCVAAASNDTVLPLWLYGAEVLLTSPEGERRVPIAEFYVADGVKNTVITDAEILTAVEIPKAPKDMQCRFEKLRMRGDIDFALANIALAWRMGDDDTVAEMRAVVGALGAKPKAIDFGPLVEGKSLDEETLKVIGDKVHKSCKPLTNIATDVDWRRQMLRVLAKRMLTKD